MCPFKARLAPSHSHRKRDRFAKKMATVRLRLSRGCCNAGVTKGEPAYSCHQSSGSEQPVLSIEALACYWLLCLVTVGGDGRQDTGGLTDALPGDSVLVVGNCTGFGSLLGLHLKDAVCSASSQVKPATTL